MGTIRRIGDDYYIEFDARGLKYQRNGGKDKKAAARLLKEIEDKIQKGEMSIVVCDVKASDFFKNFLEFIKNDNDPRTSARYESVVQHFQGFIQTELSPVCQLSQITPSVIEGYRAVLLKSTGKTGRTVKPKIINFTFYLLRDIFDHAINFGHINDNPTLHTQLIEISDQNVPQTLSDKDVQKLLKDSSGSIKNISELLLRTGMRFGELTGLKWTNVDFKNNCLKIEVLPDDPRRRRQVPMDNEVLSIISRLHDQKDARCEYVFINVAGERSEINSYSMQCVFQNTFAKNMLEKGISLVGLHKVLGFRDIARVMRYEGFTKNS